MKVQIYKPTKNVMQSGHGKTQLWVLEYETITKRRPDDLMGWTSAGDTLNQVKLKFSTMGDAVAFAEKKGWEYSVRKSHERKVKPRSYADNFKYIPPKETKSSSNKGA